MRVGESEASLRACRCTSCSIYSRASDTELLVVLRSLCPSISLTERSCAPLLTMWVAMVCRGCGGSMFLACNRKQIVFLEGEQP